ncbi:MAG TPA: hypothetical protein VKV17_15210 [Bryobacteraceae bacterium]|nr:hypothetical protein [Bryobacteraceae bacterium]
MMKAFKQIRAAMSLVNPEELRRQSSQPVGVGLVATSERGYAELENFLVPPELPNEERARLLETVYRAGDRNADPQVDFVLYEAGLPAPKGVFRHWPDDPRQTVEEILEEHDALSLPLARRFPPFRKAVVSRIVNAVARENALFAITTALPNIVPNLVELPWAAGEFASDTAFLTMNQFRMAFMIAAACGSEIGFGAQKLELGTIAASAFGWRAIARELAGKIPLGAGLIPKGAIAFAGTYLIGKGLERLHGCGVPYTAEERKQVYREGYRRGIAIAQSASESEAPPAA